MVFLFEIVPVLLFDDEKISFNDAVVSFQFIKQL